MTTPVYKFEVSKDGRRTVLWIKDWDNRIVVTGSGQNVTEATENAIATAPDAGVRNYLRGTLFPEAD